MNAQKRAFLKKEIEKNVEESDILQRANTILKNMVAEELKKENPENHIFNHKNDYLAHLKVIHQLNERVLFNESHIEALGRQYIDMSKQLLEEED